MIKRFGPHQTPGTPGEYNVPKESEDEGDELSNLTAEPVGYSSSLDSSRQAYIPKQQTAPDHGASYYSTETSPARGLSMKKNILANDVEVKGTIRFSEELLFDGKLDGEVISEGTLILGENSEVQGEIRTKAVSLSGRVQGNITVDEKCELKGRAQLIGDLKAARLVIEEGATFVGRSEVTPNRVNLPKLENSRVEEGKSAVAR